METITVNQIHFYQDQEFNLLINFLNQYSSAKHVGIDRIHKIAKNTYIISKSGIKSYYNFVNMDRRNNQNIENSIKNTYDLRIKEVIVTFDKQYHSAVHVAKLLTGLEHYEDVYYLYNNGAEYVTKHLRSVKDYLDVARNNNLPERKQSWCWKLSYHVPTTLDVQKLTIERKMKSIEYHKKQIQLLEYEISKLQMVV